MIGAKLRQRLAAGEHILMINPNHVSSGLAARLTELKADTIFIDCEHGTASFDEARAMARAARSGGGGAILRPDSHQRSLLTRYLNAGVDGLMVPLVNTAEQARAVVATVRHACPADFETRLLVCMIETVEAVGNLDEILAVEGIDVFFVGPGDLSQSMGYLPSVPRGQPRPREVLDLVEKTLAGIRAAGQLAGTLVIEEDIAHWSRCGAQLLYCHVDPFLRDKIEAMHELGARSSERQRAPSADLATGLSERVRRIKVSPTSAAAQRVRDLKALGRGVLDLTIGEPDFDTPAHIKQAAVDAIARGETKYTPFNGIAPLREAIAAKITQRTGVSYAAASIPVGGGGKQVIFLALMATLNPGSEVIIPAPYWVSYPDMVLANDGTPVIVTCQQQQSFKLTPDQLEAAITPKTRWLVLNSPGNPTGVAYDTAELRALAEVLRRHPHVGVLTDEIYDEVWFKREATPSLVQAVPDFAGRVLIVSGVSKTYAMTGWRIGYAAGPKPIIDAINMLQSQSSSCP